jgi:ACS family tartrate transporter-like MFS transporter
MSYAGTVPPIASEDFGARTIRKVQMRLLPFMFLLYIVAVLDRVNVGFAALTMNKNLAISAQQFGLLAGIFFVGYFLFEIPSNVLLHKIGARIWIGRILLTWGLVSASTALVNSASHLYVVRFLLGIAEAGFFPGMILYLTYWFRQREQAQAVAFFMTAQPISAIVGAPVSGLILDHVHWAGLASWRWLFALEAIPAMILGFVVFALLPNGPREAKFLTQDEKDWLASELERERVAKMATGTAKASVSGALTSPRVWHLTAIYFAFMIGLYSMNFWLPTVVKAFSQMYTSTHVGLLVMIPHICGLIAMILISRHSDRTLERRFHAAIPAVLGGIALLIIGRVSSPVTSIALLALMAIGIDSSFGPFWALPSRFLAGVGAASGIALINSVGNLGGFVGPYVIGTIAKKTGSTAWGLAFVGAALILAAILILLLPAQKADVQSCTTTARPNAA